MPNHIEHPAGNDCKERLVWLLKNASYNLYRATICSGPPKLAALFDELRNPQPGDLVMVTDTHLMESHDPKEGIGTLVAVGMAPYYATREEARAAGYDDDDPIPERLVWDIKLDFADGRMSRWENATFIKVKTDLY